MEGCLEARSMVKDQPALIHSSVWIRSIRRGGPPELKSAVRQAIESGLVATCPAITMELLVGARDEAEFTDLQYSMGALTSIPISQRIWADASRLGYTLLKQGFHLRMPDLLVAQCAMSSGRVLWHADSHFEQIRQYSSLQMWLWEVSP